MTLHPLVLLTLFVFAATFGLALALVPVFARVALVLALKNDEQKKEVFLRIC